MTIIVTCSFCCWLSLISHACTVTVCSLFSCSLNGSCFMFSHLMFPLMLFSVVDELTAIRLFWDMSSHSWMVHERGSIQHGIPQRSRYSQNEMPVFSFDQTKKTTQHNTIIYPNTITSYIYSLGVIYQYCIKTTIHILINT